MKHLCTALAVSLIALIGTSCEDAKVATASKNRETVREAIKTRSKSVGTADTREASLRETASGLESRGGGSPAAALMLADVRLQLGRESLRRFETTEATHRGLRLALLAKTEAVADADALAREVDAIAADQRLALLEEQIAADGGSARRTAAEQAEVIREQQLKIGQLTREVRRLAPNLEELDARANQLRKDAITLPAIEALDLVEQAAVLRKRSDQLMVQIAERELLLLQSVATSERASLARDGEESIARSNDQALATIEELRGEFRQTSSALRNAAQDLRLSIAEELRAIATDEESAWRTQAMTAITDFKQAAQAASLVASGGDRSLQESARLLEIAARQGEARTWLALAQGLAGQTVLLQRLVTLGGESSEAWRRDFEAANQARDEAMTEATAGFTAALEAIETSEGSGRPAATMIRAELTAALATLADRPAQTNDAETSSGPSGSVDGGSPAAPSGPPFASAQALFDFMKAGGFASGDPAVLEQTFRATSPGGRRMLKVTIAMAKTGEPVRQAMIETFGSAGSGLNSVGLGAGLGAPMDGVTLSTSDDGQATVESPQGAVRLLAEEGSWYLDFDSVVGAAGTDQATMAASAGAMEAMTSRLGPFFTMFAQRVRDGEFASAEEASAAMQQEMTAMMMQGMPGAPGGAGGPGGV